MRSIDIFTEDAQGYWTPKQIDYYARYTQQLTFPTEKAARDWVFNKFQYHDKQGYAHLVGINGPEMNRQLADTVPLYMSGKSYKIGKRIRRVIKPWAGVDIKRPSIHSLIEYGFINPFDGYNVLGMKMIPTRLVHETEKHSRTESGIDKVYQIAHAIKEERVFLAIITSADYTVLDGHHRLRAVRDILKWKKIAALVVDIDLD